jgi:hypothetical protein
MDGRPPTTLYVEGVNWTEAQERVEESGLLENSDFVIDLELLE